MSSEQSSSPAPHIEGLRADIRKAVEMGADVWETVRDVTLRALANGELDTASLRRVAGEVLKGASDGEALLGAEAKESIGRAIAGLDKAFSMAAEVIGAGGEGGLRASSRVFVWRFAAGHG